VPTVTWTQDNDGGRSGFETEAGAFSTIEEAIAFLEVKAASHEGRGWTVVRAPRTFHASKIYPNGRRKDRTFIVRP
jgi:hypothetical protein